MAKTKVSVIIPHKNTPLLLTRCLESIPESPDIQVIVIDDNSDKGIVDFNSFPGQNRSNVKVIFNKESRGAGYARNIGLQFATGSWLLFADADDYYTKKVSVLIDKYEGRDDIDIVYFNCKGETENNNRCRAYNGFMESYQKGESKALKQIQFNWWVPWNKMIRNEFVKAYSLTFEEVPVGNDARFGLLSSYFATKVAIETDFIYVSTYQPKGITFGKRSFPETLEYLSRMMKIWNFLNYVDAPMKFYKNNIISCRKLYSIWSTYGTPNLIRYVMCYLDEKRHKRIYEEIGLRKL